MARSPFSGPILSRFLRETRSDTAVEFALIGSVLFLFLFGILMMGIGQFWQMTLDDAVRIATRQVQIGAVTSGGQFVTAVCNDLGNALANCTSRIQYSVQGNLAVSGISPANINAAGTLSPVQFTGIIANNYLLVQVAVVIPVIIPLIPPSLVTFNGTNAFISATGVMVEP